MARSDNWRINKSAIMAIEGAQILRALKKVAGACGLPKEYTVKFSTEKAGAGIYYDTREMVIGAGRLFQEAPMNPEKFDILVGMVIHETGHYSIRSDCMYQALWGLFRPRLGTSGTPETCLEQKMLERFANIGEDIIIETRTLGNDALSDYEKSLHEFAMANRRGAEPNRLMEVWIEYALGHKTDALLNLPTELLEPMNQLVALTTWLRHHTSSSYVERASSYWRYWLELREIIMRPEPNPEPEPNKSQQGDGKGSTGTEREESEPDEKAGDDGNGDNEPEKSEPDKDEDGAGKSEPDKDEDSKDDGDEDDGDFDDNAKPERNKDGEDFDVPYARADGDEIDTELADAIADATERELEDITDEIATELDADTDEVTTTIRSRQTDTPRVLPDRILAKKLERILTIKKRLQMRVMRGEQYGKIDKRHLYRVRTDERIFNLRYKFPDAFPECRILLDMSGSMSEEASREVLQAAGALHTLVDAQVWGYYHSKTVQLVRLDDGKTIHQFDSMGNTPSGTAIVGVSLGMHSGGIVIHLTDGGHNHGIPPWNAHWNLSKRGIELINLIWHSADYTSRVLTNRAYRYPELNVRELAGLHEFPDALYRILVEKVKLCGIGGKSGRT